MLARETNVGVQECRRQQVAARSLNRSKKGSISMSFPIGSVWLIERQGAAKQKIKITGTSGAGFTAQYIGINNDSVFTGELWARETQAVSIKQHSQDTGYVSFQIGTLKSMNGTNFYQGTWCDVTGAHSGTFRLTKF